MQEKSGFCPISLVGKLRLPGVSFMVNATQTEKTFLAAGQQLPVF